MKNICMHTLYADSLHKYYFNQFHKKRGMLSPPLLKIKSKKIINRILNAYIRLPFTRPIQPAFRDISEESITRLNNTDNR